MNKYPHGMPLPVTNDVQLNFYAEIALNWRLAEHGWAACLEMLGPGSLSPLILQLAATLEAVQALKGVSVWLHVFEWLNR